MKFIFKRNLSTNTWPWYLYVYKEDDTRAYLVDRAMTYQQIKRSSIGIFSFMSFTESMTHYREYERDNVPNRTLDIRPRK